MGLILKKNQNLNIKAKQRQQGPKFNVYQSMDRGLKEHCTNGNEMAFENSNKGLSFNNNLNSLYIKKT